MFYESDLKLEEFGINLWRVYWVIAYDIIIKEKKNVLDELVVGLYLEKHKKLRSKYDDYGGWETISNATAYVKTENFHSYISELRKWNAVIKLAKHGFPIADRLSDFADMTAEDIYNEMEALLNHTFVNIDNEIKSYDISVGLDELIETLDAGFAVGLPYYNMPMITKETGGQYLGSITLIGGLSNVGKSSFVRLTLLPSIIKNKEKVVIIINEEDQKKWQREFLIYVCNVVLKYDIQKFTVRDGRYSQAVKEQLYKAAEWIKEQANNHTITIIPLESYSTEKAIKIIKKYSSLGVKQFALDTFKMDAGKITDSVWLQMQQSMVAINDVVKPASKNLHIAITFQLEKGSSKQRYYTQSNIGLSKGIVDVASTCLMIRDVYDDEYTGDKRELHVYRLEGKNGASKIPVKLDREKRYQVIFLVKNREGSANQYQIVTEVDLSRNIMKEIGITNVPIDW